MGNAARVKIGRVTLRGGASLHALPIEVDAGRRKAEVAVRATLDALGPDQCRGFAFVAWNEDGESCTRFGVQAGSSIPNALVPDYVRNLLLAQLIEVWTLESVNACWGEPDA